MLVRGAYDPLVDQLLEGELDALDPSRLTVALKPVEAAELPGQVAEVAAGSIRKALASASQTVDDMLLIATPYAFVECGES